VRKEGETCWQWLASWQRIITLPEEGQVAEESLLYEFPLCAHQLAVTGILFCKLDVSAVDCEIGRAKILSFT